MYEYDGQVANGLRDSAQSAGVRLRARLTVQSIDDNTLAIKVAHASLVPPAGRGRYRFFLRLAVRDPDQAARERGRRCDLACDRVGGRRGRGRAGGRRAPSAQPVRARPQQRIGQCFMCRFYGRRRPFFKRSLDLPRVLADRAYCERRARKERRRAPDGLSGHRAEMALAIERN